MTDKVQKIREEVERLYNQSLADENRQADRGLERAANVSYGKSKACKELLSFIDSLQEEPVSEELEEAAYHNCIDRLSKESIEDFKAGAQWQKEQFEKNRLAASDRQTEEEAEIEQSFVMGIIENEHRKPTFNDAIKYGMRLQCENMMKDAVECTICASYENPYGGFTQLVDSKTPLVTFGKEVKLIIIKEG